MFDKIYKREYIKIINVIKSILHVTIYSFLEIFCCYYIILRIFYRYNIGLILACFRYYIRIINNYSRPHSKFYRLEIAATYIAAVFPRFIVNLFIIIIFLFIGVENDNNEFFFIEKIKWNIKLD